MERRGLQVLLALIGCVATSAGLASVLRGVAAVTDGGPASANVDSEQRFYASWYVVIGVLVLRAVRRPEAETTVVRACAGGFALAALGRVLSWRSHGRPHPVFQALLAAEIAIPAVVVPWQARLARGW